MSAVSFLTNPTMAFLFMLCMAFFVEPVAAAGGAGDVSFFIDLPSSLFSKCNFIIYFSKIIIIFLLSAFC